MKNLLVIFLFFSMAAIAQNSNQTIIKEPLYMGLNGEFSGIEITYYNSPQGSISKVETYSFDAEGRLLERRCYPNRLKKVLLEKDTYKRDKNGQVIEEYKGYSLNDNYNMGESLWQMIEQKDGKERWQKIDNDWWGTNYIDVEYKDGQKISKRYVIQKKNKKESNLEYVAERFNSRGQLITESKYKDPNNPQNTKIWTYNADGHLLKVEMEQKRTDGTINKIEEKSYTIDKVDDKNNPTQITEKDGERKVIKYTYR